MKDISIYIEKLYKYDLKNEVCSVAIPFPEGELKKEELDNLDLVDAVLQVKPTAYWPDGSVKYLFLDFMADIKANQSMRFVLTHKNEQKKQEDIRKKTDCLSLNTKGEFVFVDTGKLSFAVKDNSDYIFDFLKRKDCYYFGEQFVGPTLSVNGNCYGIHIDQWEVLEQGKVKAVLLGQGHYNEHSRVTVRITVYAGKEYMDLACRLFNDSMEELVPDSWSFFVKRTKDSILNPILEHTKNEKLDSTGCGDMNKGEAKEGVLFYQTTGTGELAQIESAICKKSQSKIRSMAGISNYKTRFQISGEGESVSNWIDADALISEANEHFAEVLYGTFMADVTDKDGGVCATVFQAHQNFPKAIKADADGVCVYLIPEGTEKVVFSSGMARQQRIQLHFHSASESLEEIDNRSLIYQMPIIPCVEPEQFKRAKVFPEIITDFEHANDEVELSLISKADTHGRAYGMMNWGDFPDSNYTAQGRGGGRLVWTNNEYDYPHAMFMMYARTGIRRFLDYAKTAALHWMDVDVCHYSTDPLRINGQWEHTAGHNGGSGENSIGVMVCSHEWVEGLLDLWHFTGDVEAYHTALGIGENVLRLLDTPMYQKAGEANARETGWALRTLMALYLETNDKKWLVKCDWILEQFVVWKEKYGAWLAPYTDNTVIRVGFMISVALGSIMRYYRVFPKQELKDMMIEAVDDLILNFRNPYGLFYYKELPSLKRNGNNTLLLEAMYIGYELTGDTKYLEAGLKTFWNSICTEAKYEGGKKKVEDAVLVGNAPTKSFAQSFLPLTLFYNAIVKEKLI